MVAIDFSLFGDIPDALQGAQNGTESGDNRKLSQVKEVPLEGQVDVSQFKYAKLLKEEREKAAMKEAANRQTEAYYAYQDAIRKGERLRSEITKGIRTGENPTDLLLKAVECISLMTGDKLFYDQSRESIERGPLASAQQI